MSRRSLLLGAFGVLVLALCPGVVRAWETSDAECERENTLSQEYITPHTPWARPYAQGPVRTCYMVGCSDNEGMNTYAREGVELMQRVDVKLDAALWYRYYGFYWFGGGAGTRRISRLMQNPYDVFIFSGQRRAKAIEEVGPSKIPVGKDPNPQELFLQQVREGAGVVMIGVDDANGPLMGAVALEAAPSLLADCPDFKFKTFGAGRIVLMPPAPLIPYRVGWEVEYDYWQEKLARAVLWAAKREPGVQVGLAVEKQLDRAMLPAKAITVSWRGATPGQTVIDLRLRRWDDQQTPLGMIQCNAAEGKAAVKLPRAMAGGYHVDAFARNARGTEGWATAEVQLTSTARIASLSLISRQEIPQLLPKDKNEPLYERLGVYTPFVEIGEMIRGKVTADGAPQGSVIRLELLDRRGRMLVRKLLPAEGEQSFAFKAEPWMPMLLRAQATLVKGDEEIAGDYRYQRITKRGRGRYNFVLWDCPRDETLAPYAMEKLAEMGVTCIVGHTAPLSVSAYDITFAPWTGGSVSGRDAEQWSDANYNTWFVQHEARSRGAGAFLDSLGDEGAVSGIGDGPKSDAAFQQFLKGIYGDVGAVNRSWGTNYASLEEIQVKPLKAAATQPFSPSANTAENHARDYDLFYFGGYNFVQMNKLLRGRLKTECDDPQAWIGFEGSGDLAHRMNCDPELICRELNFWVPYVGVADEFVRSVAPRQFVRSGWEGYARDAQGFCGRHWRILMSGADSSWYWMWSTLGAFIGFQRPDLGGAEPIVQEMLDDSRCWREGLGDLLLQYKMEHDGVAVVYSYPTFFVSGRTERNKSYGSYQSAFLCWQNVIQDLGLQFNYVTDRMLADGEFDASQYKVLILPQTLCLDARAAAAVRKFVEGGGTVIADVRPGLYDQRGHQQGNGQLDDLFGVAGGFAPAAKADLKIDGGLGEAKLSLVRPVPAYDHPVLSDPTVKVTTGKAMGTVGEAPACIVNTVGKGRAFLLNFMPATSFEVRGEVGNLRGDVSNAQMPIDEGYFFLGLMKSAGVQAPFQLSVYKKETVPFMGNVKVQRWSNGQYQVVGFFRESDKIVDMGAVIFTDATKTPWICDIKHGLALGRSSYTVFDVIPGKAALFAFLPGPVPPMAIELPKEAVRGTPAVVKVSVPKAGGLHAIRLTAVGPDGKPADFWNQNIIVGVEAREIVLPLAFNDSPGTWTLTFTDAFSPTTRQTLKLMVK